MPMTWLPVILRRRGACAALIILLSAALLSACATGAQQQATRWQEATSAAVADNQACYTTIFQKPDYAHLSTKALLNPNSDQMLRMLTDNSRPTKQEIADLYKLHADVQKCRKVAIEGAAKIHPAYVTVFAAAFTNNDKRYVELVSGRMTWGKFNTESKTASEQIRQQFAAVDMQIKSELQNEHQFELAQRQRAAASLQQWAYQQQVLENQRIAASGQAHAAAMASRPVTCNFNQMGPNTMTCN